MLLKFHLIDVHGTVLPSLRVYLSLNTSKANIFFTQAGTTFQEEILSPAFLKNLAAGDVFLKLHLDTIQLYLLKGPCI